MIEDGKFNVNISEAPGKILENSVTSKLLSSNSKKSHTEDYL